MACYGFDFGTYNLICCNRDEEGNFAHKREVNAFLKVPLEDRFVFNMMKNAGVPLIERDKVAYALGESAVKMSYTMRDFELKRPMKDGCVNPEEKDAFEIMNIMAHSLIENIKQDKETLYYSVPANAVNQETDADYHQKILQSIFDAYESEEGYKLNAHPINEALALVYAELQDKKYTGIGISCLCPGTKIYTKKGILNIEEVKENDEVLTHKGRWRKINKVITKKFTGKATKFTIAGWSNNHEDYKFVDNHELYVKRNNEWQWIGCEEIVKGDIVGEPFENTKLETNITMTICDKITSSKKTIKRSIEVGPNVLRLIGYFLADGSVNSSEGCIQFDFANKETDYIQDVKEILKNNFNKESYIKEHGENCTRVVCYSKGMVNYFKNHFYDENRKKLFPWKLEKLNKSGCINLLAGLIRGDGHITNDSINFENTNSHLAHLCKRLLSKIGIASSISYREPKDGNILANGRIIKGKQVIWKVCVGNKLSVKGLEYLIENANTKNCSVSERIWIDGNMCCGRVSDIVKEDYEGIVYDLQVEEDHSFSGPMLTIHNCGAGMVNLCFALYGAPMFQFSIVNSGDWIDKQAAKATGESITFINQEKTKVDLSATPKNLVERAIQTQYRIMVEKTVQKIKVGLETNDRKARNEDGIDIVIAGGTSMAKGFDVLIKDVINQANLPIKISNIIKPADPLYSVARGCLIAAENASF